MTLDDMALAAKRRALKSKKRHDSAVEVEVKKRGEAESNQQGSDLCGNLPTKLWALGDNVTLGLLAINILLIAVAPCSQVTALPESGPILSQTCIHSQGMGRIILPALRFLFHIA